mmetsp:Transcript_9097/g.16007  ORF Transcript_9097/g.16007 Transcript_9097/m.16007 type:complete len:96 (+) Transcript_9097:314-601(+)
MSQSQQSPPSKTVSDDADKLEDRSENQCGERDYQKSVGRALGEEDVLLQVTKSVNCSEASCVSEEHSPALDVQMVISMLLRAFTSMASLPRSSCH